MWTVTYPCYNLQYQEWTSCRNPIFNSQVIVNSRKLHVIMCDYKIWNRRKRSTQSSRTVFNKWIMTSAGPCGSCKKRFIRGRVILSGHPQDHYEGITTMNRRFFSCIINWYPRQFILFVCPCYTPCRSHPTIVSAVRGCRLAASVPAFCDRLRPLGCLFFCLSCPFRFFL